MGRLLVLICALLMGGLIAWRVQTPPAPRPANTPAQMFSAERAMADIVSIAARPHPTGSGENAAVRQRLVARMTAMGLQTRIQSARSVEVTSRVTGADVVNLIGVLPGRDRAAPALALVAHYDSAPGSPGAADDAAGVAAALEVVRAIKATGAPARDVVVLLTDAEEIALLGARAFFEQDPLAHHIGFILNMEARGGGGRVQMFETGRAAGDAVDLFARTARQPQANSLAAYVYARMPNDTDFTVAKALGISGFNYAFLGRYFDYHAPTSTPANLDRHALQDMGDQVLAAASALAFAPALPARSPDKAYASLFGDLMVVYPPEAGWAGLAICAVLIVLALVRAARRTPLSGAEIARGAGAAVFALLGSAAVLHFARRASGVGLDWMDQRTLLAQAVRWETCVLLLGTGFLVLAAAEVARGRRAAAAAPLLAGLAGCAFGGLDQTGLALGLAAGLVGILSYGRGCSRPNAWAGVLLASLVVAALAQILAPTAAVILILPLLLASACAALTCLAASERRPDFLLMGLFAAVGLGWIGGVAHFTYLALDLPELLAIAVWMAAPLVWPLAQPAEGAPPARLLGPLLLAAGLATLFTVRFDPPWSARHPQAAQVAYRLDLDDNTAVRSADVQIAWTQAALNMDGGDVNADRHWAASEGDIAAPASVALLPGVGLRHETSPTGEAVLIATPPPGARNISLDLRPDRQLRLIEIGGRPVDMVLPAGAWTKVWWAAASTDLTLTFADAERVTLAARHSARLDTWPAEVRAPPAPPAKVMGFGSSGSSLVVGTYRASW